MTGTKYIGMDAHKESISIAVRNAAGKLGELRIGVADAADYANVRASVTSDELDAPPFGESHGGLFRSFGRSAAVSTNWWRTSGLGSLPLNETSVVTKRA